MDLHLCLCILLSWSLQVYASNGAEKRAEQKSEMSNGMVLLVIGLLILTVLTIWLFKVKMFRFVHETGLCLLYGMIAGVIIRYTGSGFHRKAVFDPEVFFYGLLPPIIFYAGYDMKKRFFFRNLGTILTFAFVGTTISCIVFGGLMYGFVSMFSDSKYPGFRFQECLLFGSLISATDPVTILAIFHDLNVEVDLYAIVFGESVMNDAVAIVLYRSILTYSKEAFSALSFFEALGVFLGVFAGSFLLGSVMGLLTALLTKLTKIGQFPRLETALFTLMSYSTFLIAEAAGLTGIVTVLFCGIVQAHYTYNNLTQESQVATKEIFGLLNFLAENFIFSYMGLTVFTFESHDWNVGFIAWTFLACAVSRACNIYPLSYLLNKKRSKRIEFNSQHMLWFGGLRGAVAFALAIRNTESAPRQLMLSSVLVVAIATVVINGGLTTQALSRLGIRVNVDVNGDVESVENTTNNDEPDQPDLVSATDGRSWFVSKWHHFDVHYMKPLFTSRAGPVNINFPRCFCCQALNSCCDVQTTSTIADDDVYQGRVGSQIEHLNVPSMKRLLTYV